MRVATSTTWALALVIVGLPCSFCRGQEDSTGKTIQRDARLKALVGGIPLRDEAPRDGLIYWKGKEVGKILRDETLLVMNIAKVKTLQGEQNWLQVKRENQTIGRNESREGWVYSGDTGQKSRAFQVVPR